MATANSPSSSPHFRKSFRDRLLECVFLHVRNHVDHLGCVAAGQHHSPERRNMCINSSESSSFCDATFLWLIAEYIHRLSPLHCFLISTWLRHVGHWWRTLPHSHRVYNGIFLRYAYVLQKALPPPMQTLHRRSCLPQAQILCQVGIVPTIPRRDNWQRTK